MGEGGGVHHHGDAPVRGLVHPMHHLRFVIGLAHIDVKAVFDPPPGAESTQLLEILRTVHIRLTHSEPPQIRPIDHHDLDRL